MQNVHEFDLSRHADTIVDAAPVGILMIDQSGEIILVNEALQRLFGYSREELLGQPVELLVPDDFRPHHPSLRQAFFANPVQRPMGQGRDLCGKHKSGALIPVELGLTPIALDGGIIALGTVVDLTERQKSKERMNVLNSELAKSNNDLEQFAYAASHDLQEPLRKISSYCQLLREENPELSGDSQEYLKIAIDGAGRLQMLIRDLLAFSRITTRGKPLMPTSVNESVREAIENLEISIREAGATITFEQFPKVMADHIQLVMLFQNLIGNALKYCRDTPPVVHVGGRDQGTTFEFFVRDNGIGIDPRFHQRIFQIFQRLNNRREYRGSGVGLAVCKRIVERFHGEIWVESALGKGSVFYFRLNKFISG